MSKIKKPIKECGKFFESEFWYGIRPKWYKPKNYYKANQLAELIYVQINEQGNVYLSQEMIQDLNNYVGARQEVQEKSSSIDFYLWDSFIE